LCRARLGQSPICPRCGADHSLAQAAEAQAERHLHAALAALASNRRAALAHAHDALALRRTPLNEAVARWLDRQLAMWTHGSDRHNAIPDIARHHQPSDTPLHSDNANAMT
jgi:hypothetical protein